MVSGSIVIIFTLENKRRRRTLSFQFPFSNLLEIAGFDVRVIVVAHSMYILSFETFWNMRERENERGRETD